MENEQDQLAGMPERYNYIRDVVLRYTRGGRTNVKEWQSTVDALSEDGLAQIAEVYRRMDVQKDSKGLSAWIEQQSPEVRTKWEAWQELRDKEEEDEGRPWPPEPQQEPRAVRLFELFSYLRKKGTIPFRSGKVKFRPPSKKLDWSKLPPELSYLRKPAEKYGIVFGDEQRLKVVRHIKRRQPKLLKYFTELAARTRAPGEQERIQKFLKEYRIDFNPEAARVFYLMALLWELLP